MTTKYNVEIIGKNENALRFRIKREESYLSFLEIFELWEHSVEFIRFYVSFLNSVDYLAYYWEHPALSNLYLNKRYECILQRSQPLDHLPINERAFSKYILKEDEVVDFMNLGKNARLIVPSKKSKQDIYNHLGKFLQLAKEDQIISLFHRIGHLIKKEIDIKKIIWLNTAGLGVIWLHIRLDTKPKYYKTANYKRADFLEKLL
ncbi:MAG TPA: hypothetical protein ENK52_00890 [Saprospiraceae bacterium]|nr:hypothetical protein [Saprospiraceae bacterium]